MAGEKPLQEEKEIEKLRELVAGIVTAHAGRHPGITTEAIVEELVRCWDLHPFEGPYRERRRNHPERIRRLSHAVFRALDADPGEAAAVAVIVEKVLDAFRLVPRRAAPSPPAGGDE